MTKEEIPRKWEYIAARLRELDAPAKVINAAVEIDNAMVKLGLGNHTCEWISLYNNHLSSSSTAKYIFYEIVMTSETCTACEDVDHMCSICKLGGDNSCTPRSKHADDYFTIVRRWLMANLTQ